MAQQQGPQIISHAHTGVGVEIVGAVATIRGYGSHAHTGVGVEIRIPTRTAMSQKTSRPHGRGSRNSHITLHPRSAQVTPTRAWE